MDQESGDNYPTFSINTTAANDMMKEIHNVKKGWVLSNSSIKMSAGSLIIEYLLFIAKKRKIFQFWILLLL